MNKDKTLTTISIKSFCNQFSVSWTKVHLQYRIPLIISLATPDPAWKKVTIIVVFIAIIIIIILISMIFLK